MWVMGDGSCQCLSRRLFYFLHSHDVKVKSFIMLKRFSLLLPSSRQLARQGLAVLGVDLVMALLYLQRPLRFDPGQHGHDLVIAQHAVVDRHGGAIVRLVDELGKAMLGDGKKLRIRMVPGVAAGIVRRRRKQAIRSAITPVGLAFALGAVAGDTVLSVYASAYLQDLRIIRTQGMRQRCLPPATGTQEEIEDSSHHEQDQSPSHAKDKWSQFHFKFSDATPAVIDR